MGSYVLVVFVRRLAEGAVFERSAWPLHATLLRFDTREGAGTVASRVGPALAGVGSFAAEVGAEAGFGRDGGVPVSLLDPDSGLASLHGELLEAFVGHATLPGAQHTRSGYRPHVSHTAGRPRRGDRLLVDHVALIDMRPDGDPSRRRVAAVWPLVPAGT
ncbi:2'-5' RNA ligase family protein [Arthrobacter halodurans]|uniref:2'-5' RNA ligase family protein n=1 Tax=Arthrobacter halodurans TaxID=516699 RepID=A0ABV4UND8_9MICC